MLDVSVLVSYLAPNHEHHRRVVKWRARRSISLCPIVELGFLRVSCALGFTMASARHTLADFLRDEDPLFVPCDRRVLDCPVTQSPRQTTDIYLADLAAAHGMRFATLDTHIDHPAVDLVPELNSPTASY